MCFALAESGWLSVNIPPARVNQCISAMSVPVAESSCWRQFKDGRKVKRLSAWEMPKTAQGKTLQTQKRSCLCVTAYIWPSVEYNCVLSDVSCFSDYVCTECLQSSHSLLQLAKYSTFFFLIESVFSAKWMVLAQSFHPRQCHSGTRTSQLVW